MRTLLNPPSSPTIFFWMNGFFSPLASPASFFFSFTRYPTIYKNPVNMQDTRHPHHPPARPFSSYIAVFVCTRAINGDLPKSRENLPAPRQALATTHPMASRLFFPPNWGRRSRRGKKAAAPRRISPRNNAFSHSFCAFGTAGCAREKMKGRCASF